MTVAGVYARIETHEEICAERYAGIRESMSDVKGAIKDQARTQWAILLAIAGFLAYQLYVSQPLRDVQYLKESSMGKAQVIR